MLPRILRPLLAAAVFFIGLAPVLAQRSDLEQLRKPTTVPQFWNAIKNEMNQGKFDTAAEYLKGMLALNPTDKDLLAIEEKEGISVFLNLNNIPRWSNNEAVNKDAKDNVQKLIAQVTAAVKKLRADPERIQKYIRNLTATAEERDYAFLELRKSGAVVMPQLIGAVQNADLQERAALISILPRLGPETVPALLAAFDIPNPTVRVEFLNVLQARKDILELLNHTPTDPRPTLWHLSTGNDLVASKAKLLLSSLTRTPLPRLPLATTELIRAADEIYQHKNTLAKEPDLTLWKWDGRQITATKATVTQAEEFYGLRYARWALEREPGNEPAQVIFLSIATEKALERGGLEAPLAKSSPAVHELLAVAPASVLYAMLDRALREEHYAVALGATQVIGERAELHGKGGFDPLVKALNSQDRRVALAAADALIRLPNNAGAQVSSRIVEVYRAALAAPPGTAGAEGAAKRPRALIGDPNELRARLLSEVVEQAGFEPVTAHTGRDVLRRLNQAADIDVLWIHHEVAFPQLPDFLGQVRSDFRYGKLPLFVTVASDMSRARLDEIELALEQLDANTRSWMYQENTLDASAKVAKAAQPNNGEPKADLRERRRLVIDRGRYPIRVDLHYDALQLTGPEMQFLQTWLADLRKEHPNVRQTTWDRQRILITIAKDLPGLGDRLRDMNAGLPLVVARRVSESLYTLELPSGTVPDVLNERIADLLRDFAYELKEGARARVLGLSREIPTSVSLTSMRVPPPQQLSTAYAAPAAGEAPRAPERLEVAWNAELEEDKIQRAVSRDVESRLRALLANYRNVELIAEPLNATDVYGAMKHMQTIAGPMSAPLSEAERKDHQRRAIDALRQMATGAIAGYDVRPAQAEILDALRSDELAPAAIEAAGRLSGKESQQRLAEVTVNVARPAGIRNLAANELVRNVQRFGPTSITDAQIGALIRLFDEEKNADVKAAISLVLGVLPRERVLKNFPDDKSREAWLGKLLNYQPLPPPAPAPKPEGN